MTDQPSIEQLIVMREDAMGKVRAWWDTGALDGHYRDHTKAPAWLEYIAAFSALDKALDSQGT